MIYYHMCGRIVEVASAEIPGAKRNRSMYSVALWSPVGVASRVDKQGSLLLEWSVLSQANLTIVGCKLVCDRCGQR